MMTIVKSWLTYGYQHILVKSSDDLGRCDRVLHKINTGVATPCRQLPKRQPIGKREVEKKEVLKMLYLLDNDPCQRVAQTTTDSKRDYQDDLMVYSIAQGPATLSFESGLANFIVLLECWISENTKSYKWHFSL